MAQAHLPHMMPPTHPQHTHTHFRRVDVQASSLVFSFIVLPGPDWGVEWNNCCTKGSEDPSIFSFH